MTLRSIALRPETNLTVAEQKHKALFIDRDGIINEDTAYPHRPDQIRFFTGIFPLLRKASERGYLLIVITNQAGIAKGKFTEQDVEKLHEWMSREFASKSVSIARFYYCPHHPEAVLPQYRKACDCRKPRPGMVERAMRDFSIDIASSLVIGDKPSDRIAMPGLRSIIVKSRYSGDEYDVAGLSEVEKYL